MNMIVSPAGTLTNCAEQADTLEYNPCILTPSLTVLSQLMLWSTPRVYTDTLTNCAEPACTLEYNLVLQSTSWCAH
jgi:hypothetical protein